MNKKINAAIIGTGRMAQVYYDLLVKKKLISLVFLIFLKKILKNLKKKIKYLLKRYSLI